MGAEEAQMVVESMAQTGVEPTYCMGDDIPLAVMSDKSHVLYNYFKQRFAQASEQLERERPGYLLERENRSTGH